MESAKPGLVVEADFVPCRRFGLLTVPFDPSIDVPILAYLYAIGPVFITLMGMEDFLGILQELSPILFLQRQQLLGSRYSKSIKSSPN